MNHTILRRSLICVILVVCSTHVMQAQRPHAAQQYGFAFNNFATPLFGWDIFCRSFFDVPFDSTGLTAPLDLLIYHLVFKEKLAGSIGGGGNCYGISAQSLMMNKIGGFKGFCCPTQFYGGDRSGTGPSDPRLKVVINIMHGHQISIACLMNYLDQTQEGRSRNARNAVQRFRETFASEGACLVNITKNFSPETGGHTMIAYKLEEVSDGVPEHWRIYVVDPNRQWFYNDSAMRGWYTRGENYIDVRGGLWTFDMGDPWPNASTTPGISGGHLICLPISVAGPTGRVPSSLGLGLASDPSRLLNLLAQMIISGKGAAIEQVVTPDGRRMLDPTTGEPEADTSRALRRFMPWIHSGGEHTSTSQMYVTDRPPMHCTSTIHTGDDGATTVWMLNGSYAKVVTRTPHARCSISYKDVGTATPTLVISADRMVSVDVEFYRIDPSQQRASRRAWHDVVIDGAPKTFEGIDVVEGVPGQP